MDMTPCKDPKTRLSNSSTPLTHLTTRKRKLDSFIASPKLSSTFNDSLVTNFNEIHLVEQSLASTPEKQLKLATSVCSPIQESRKILYSTIKVVKPERKCLTRAKTVCLDSQSLLQKILNINVIMDVIFKNLSGGDLYRFSLVSPSFHKALEKSSKAFSRYKVYKNVYRDNKENYVITPPGSPEKCDSPPRTSSENFNKFIRAARYINRSQSLAKCRKCDQVAVVDSDICQCQNISCGLIYCLRCSSCSETGPKDFKDSCGHASLRIKLGNVSNRLEDSYFNFSSQDSGFYSENESPPKVKRNLFSKTAGNPKVLSVCNRNSVLVVAHEKKEVSCLPVVPNKQQMKTSTECDSPERFAYAVGSKQSKRNLKRLTR